MKDQVIKAPHHKGACQGKIGYIRREVAEFEAQRLADQLTHRTSVYLCCLCNEYHVGKNESGEFIPGTPPRPEGENEREELVTERQMIEASLDELRLGRHVDRGWEKKRRLIARKNAIDLRLSQIKLMRKVNHNLRMKQEQEAKRERERQQLTGSDALST